MDTVPLMPSDYVATQLLPRLTGLSLPVHSVFDRAFNLRVPAGASDLACVHLLAVTDSSLGGSPFGLVATAGGFPSLLRRRPFPAALMFDGQALRAEDIVLPVEEGPGYPTTFRAPAGRSVWDGDRLRREVLDRRLLSRPPEGQPTLARLLEAWPPDDGGPVEESWLRKAAPAVAALARGRPLLEAATALLGLGVGLTPSGDDFLVGFLAAGPDVAPDEAAKLLRQAEVATNDIAHAYLRHAVARRYSTHLRDFLLCLWGLPEGRSISDASRAEALDRVLATGAASGWDLVTGVVAGLSARRTRATLRRAGPPRTRDEPRRPPGPSPR